MLDAQRAELGEAGGIDSVDFPLGLGASDSHVDFHPVADLRRHHVETQHVGLDLQLLEPADLQQRLAGRKVSLVADRPVEHHAVDGAEHLSAPLVDQHLLQLGLGLGLLFLQHRAGEFLATDVLADHRGHQVGGRADGDHRRMDQLVLLVVHVALHLIQHGPFQIVLGPRAGGCKLSDPGQVASGIAQFGLARDHPFGGGLNRRGGRFDELQGLLIGGLLDGHVGVFLDARLQPLDDGGGLLDGQLQVAGDDLGHDLPLFDLHPLDQRDGFDPAGDWHGNQIGLRQPGFGLLVDELADGADLCLGSLDGHARREPAPEGIDDDRRYQNAADG